MTYNNLSRDDVARLLTDRSTDARVGTAAKLATDFDRGILSPSERQLAEEIFRLMVKDAEVRVRCALAVNLKESDTVPHDIALTLAQDVEAVALPMLQFSKVLSDSDLIEIVRTESVIKQVAIARRAAVSSALSDALVDTRNAEVVVTLIANEGADITERALHQVEEEFRGDPDVQAKLQQRARLPDSVAADLMGLAGADTVCRTTAPVTVAERLVTAVSEQLQDQLVSQCRLADDVAAELMAQTRERATITLSAGAQRDDVEGLVRHLRANGRLTPSLLLRAVCVGDMAFFEAGMAEFGGVPITNAQKLIHDPGKRGLRALYERTSLPEALYPAFRCAVDVAAENQFDGGENDRERYCRRMIERVLTQYEKLGVTFDSNDLEYLLAKLGHLKDGFDATT